MIVLNRLMISLAMGLIISLTSCHKVSTPQKPTQTLRTSLSFDVSSLDPRKGVDMTTQGIIRAIYAGLVYIDDDLNPTLDLAASYRVSDDFKTYIFFLRDCYWSDGSPVTARDFEESWKLALTPAYTSNCTNLFYLIKNAKQAFFGTVSIDDVGVRALDDKTLVVELEDPTPDFLKIVINSVFFPVHESIRYGTPDPTHLISSGPFCLKKYVFQDRIVLEKNHHYWQAEKIRLDEIDFAIIKDPETAVLMFEKGELDWLGEPLSRLSLDALPTLKTSGLLNWTEVAGTQWLFINTKKFPFSNINIRKALALAIDRTKIMRDILHLDNPSLPLGIIPKILKKEKWHPWFKDNDIALAKEYFNKGLEELNMTKADFPSITISTVSGPGYAKVVQAIQQMWKEAFGISVKSENMDGPVFVRKLYNLDYEIARTGWALQYDDAVNLLDTFKSKDMQPNFTAWENRDYIKETDAAFQSSEEEKWKHIEAAERLFFDEMPAIPFADATVAHLQKPYVKHVKVNHLFHIDFREAYLER